MSGLLSITLFVFSSVIFMTILSGTEGAPTMKMTQSGVLDDDEIVAYLVKYKYITVNEDGKIDQEALKEAIKKFQHMAGIVENGDITKATKELMSVPRCGFPDVFPSEEESMGAAEGQTESEEHNSDGQDSENNIATVEEAKSRKKRFATGPSWPKTDLTYKIENYTPDMDSSVTRRVIQDSFKFWSDASRLAFVEKSGSEPVDIDIKFGAGYHGDNYPFDGPRGVLGHGYLPYARSPVKGDIHFDEDEYFTDGSYYGVNLFQVSVHEMGHSLGLAHSSHPDAIMAPFYRGYMPGFKLHQDDIDGIQSLYGGPETPQQTQSQGQTQTNDNFQQPSSGYVPAAPDLCQDSTFDAVARTQSDYYIFKGAYYYKLNSYGSGVTVASGYPRLIRSDWSGLPDDIDAAVYLNMNGSTLFFKGNQLWEFQNHNLVRTARADQAISGFPGDVDAAFYMFNRLHFTKGDRYWRLNAYHNNGVDGSPQPLSRWFQNGPSPHELSAAIMWKDYRLYLFSGMEFYRYNPYRSRVERNYPKQVDQQWLRCQQGGQYSG